MPLTEEHYQQIREQRAAIRRYIIRHLEQRPRGIVDLTFRQFGIGSAIVYQELRNLVSQGYVRAEGNTSGRRNYLTEKGKALRKRQGQENRSSKAITRKEKATVITNNQSVEKGKNTDAEILTRKPRNYLEVERLAWLKRMQKKESC